MKNGITAIGQNPHRLCIAPMMACTDRHARYFLRLFSRHARLYTEMVTVNALLNGDREHHLQFHPAEQPIALQLGGSDPALLARAAQIGASYGYNEINLNVGCPSHRVSNGHFGACLIAHPALVGRCVEAMQKVVDIPVTVKCRIGIDDMDIDESLDRFVTHVLNAGCHTLIVHARKAWLNGLSPKENRTVPPINYDRVYRLKRDFPEAFIVINGEIKTMEDGKAHLDSVDGVMIGRAAYETPYILANADQELFQSVDDVQSRLEILKRLLPYVESELSRGTALRHMTRHLLGLFAGCPGARAWRRHLTSEVSSPGASAETILKAAEFVHSDRIAA